MKITKPSGGYDVQEFDEMILYTSGSYQVTIPHARGTGRELWVANFGTGAITVKPQATEQIHYDTDVVMYEDTVIHLIDLESQSWVII